MRENITCLCVWVFFPLILSSYVLTFLNDPYNWKKIFWFVFLSNDNLLSCNAGLDEVETRMFDILYPLCAENMENQQTLNSQGLGFLRLVWHCHVSLIRNMVASVYLLSTSPGWYLSATQARAKTEAASNLYFKNCFNVLWLITY